ncbi:MAG: hypothetical protein V1707_01030 [bacterium]
MPAVEVKIEEIKDWLESETYNALYAELRSNFDLNEHQLALIKTAVVLLYNDELTVEAVVDSMNDALRQLDESKRQAVILYVFDNDLLAMIPYLPDDQRQRVIDQYKALNLAMVRQLWSKEQEGQFKMVVKETDKPEKLLESLDLAVNKKQSLIKEDLNQPLELMPPVPMVIKQQSDYFTEADKQEVEEHKGRIQAVAIKPPPDYKGAINIIIQIIPSLPEGVKKQLTDTVEMRLRSVREAYQFRQTVKQMGEKLKWDPKVVETVIKQTEGEAKKLHHYKDSFLADIPSTIKKRPVSEWIPKSKPKEEAPIQPIQPISATIQKKLEPAKEPLSSSTLRMDRTPAKQPVQDVYQKKLVSPTDELKTMTLADWRRLSHDPKERAVKILDRLESLKAESWPKMAEGRGAWKLSPVQDAYRAIARQTVATGQQVEAIIVQGLSKDSQSLTGPEFQAISWINRQLNF